MIRLRANQIDSARRTVAALRRSETGMTDDGAEWLPGYDVWFGLPDNKHSDYGWANELEAAITEAEGTQADPVCPNRDADERQFWRETFTLALRVHGADMAADAADEALARYRKAFGGES